MANPHRGEVEMVVDGVTYRMALSMHSLALIRKQTGMKLTALIKSMQDEGDDVDPDKITAVIWAAIQTYHPDVTFDGAARMVPPGGIGELAGKIEELFQSAFPQNKAARENPLQAAKRN